MTEKKAKAAAKKVTASAIKTADKAAVAATSTPAVVAKPEVAVKKVAVAAAAAKASAPKSAAPVSPEDRYRMVQTAAYYIAEANKFVGNTTDYWMAAELEIANKLKL
jgi:Protein of unknown function (DUF2934)